MNTKTDELKKLMQSKYKRYEKKTIKIKPKILKIAKIQAIEDNITLSKLISIALKEYLGKLLTSGSE